MSPVPAVPSAFPAPPHGPDVLTVPPQTARPAPPERLAPPRDAAERAAHEGTPLVDDLGDGTCAVTFVVPDAPGVSEVLVVANKIADPHRHATSAAERVPGAWALTYRMPRAWRGSYALAVVRPDAEPDPAQLRTTEARRARALGVAEPAHHAALHHYFDALALARPDPRARERLPDGTTAVSLPGAPAEPSTADGPPGTVLDGSVGGRPLWLHEPAGTDPGDPLPLLVVLDGERWRVLGLPAALDGLVSRGEVPPLRTVGVAAAPGVAARAAELSCSPAFLDHLRTDVLGWAAGHRALTPDPARTAVAGQSLGGLTALYATQAAPERFGRALVQSGSFWWPTGPHARWLTRVLPRGPRTHGVYLEVGDQEWVLLEPTRELRAALVERGDPLTYREFCGGHDPACWRATIADGVRSLFRVDLPTRTVG